MLSMCGLLCSVLRGWRHNQAVMLMARALSQTNASLLVQDLSHGSGSGSGQGRGGFSPFCVVEGEKGLSQLLWCDNNKQAMMVSPRQCVDLQRWTLFLSSTTLEPEATPPCPGANGTTGKPEEDGEGTTITVLLEATYRDRDEEIQPEYHVMVEQLSQPYAWKARDVFGVIVTTTPPQLLAMIQAFFNNALHIDDDFLIKKIITIEVVGKPASLVDPLSIPDCVTPGPWSAGQCALTQMELARSLSPSGAQGMREAAMSNPNLQRSSSPLVRGMSHSSTFSSSPLRRPSSATPAYSPAKRGLCSSTGGSQVGEVGGMPLMRVEEEGPQRKNLDSATDKPPNVLVYAANNAEYYEKVKQTLGKCLNPDRYTIYHLTDELAFKSPWSGSTTLLVVCGDVPAHISTVFIRYLLKGGRVMSVCSDFLNMAVPLFGTVEVQEQAVVSVSYQRWNSVHLLHHQHCFHSSPRNKRFSHNTEVPPKDPANRSAVSVEPTHVEIIDEYGGRHRLDLRVLATDDTWGAPTLLSAKVHDGQGTAVFSQVHLEHDPQASMPATSEATSQLAGSNTARLEILQELLAAELSLDTSSHPFIAYTPAYFLGRHELKEELLNHLQPHMVEERLQRSHTSIEFVKPGRVPKQPAHNLLPILTSACPLTFSTVKYFETLTTTSLGRLVIYCEVISSSMRVVGGNPPLVHGLVVIPTQQTHGQGRGGNVWLSPLGCAMFSIQLHFHLSSPLGQHLSFLQHLVAMAVVQAVVTLPGYNDIPLHLKWPNDIYIGSNLKIGGVVVEATTAGPQVIANVGCGVNLSNSNPTGCLNDAIRQYNQEHNTELAEFEREVFLARVFNALEELINTFQNQGPAAVQHTYYKYWLHSNAVVTVQSEHRHTQSAEVVGVDSYGFLQARLSSGETITLQPDGNSFDMMEGLVYSKVK